MPAGRGGKQQRLLLEHGGGAGVSEHACVTVCGACLGVSVRIHVGVLGVLGGVPTAGSRGVGSVPGRGHAPLEAGGTSAG